MKKILSVLLTLVFILSASLSVAEDVFKDGFDPDAVNEGVLAIMNEDEADVYSIQAVPDQPGKYYLLYKGENIGLSVEYAHKDMYGRTNLEPGVCNKIVFTMELSGNASSDTANTVFLTWANGTFAFLRVVASVEDFQSHGQPLANEINKALKSPGYVFAYSIGQYLARISIYNSSSGNKIIAESEYEIMGLY